MPMTTTPDQIDAPRVVQAPKFPEFVAMMASLMALTALSIDIMLPALPLIRDSYGVVDANAQQLVITLYMVGFGVGQLFYGTLSDRFGRKVVLGAGLAVYAAAAALCLIAPSFEVLLAARLLQGMANAAPRVVAVAVVRDLYGGRRMAEVMSFVMTVFIIVPAVAPALGSGILLLGDWHEIFLFLGVVAMAILVWTAARLPETRPRELREPLSLAWVGAAFRQVVATRQTIGYTLATGVAFGGMMAYINSAEQIYNEVYEAGGWFTLLFALVALAMAGAAITNSRLVARLGMRKIGHTALICYAAVGGVHMALEMLPGTLALPAFMVLMMLQLYCFGLIMPNFNAIAMEPQGRIAGTASSFVGFATTGIAAFLGWLVGQSYDGTALPLAAGYFAFGAASLVMVLVVERGRLWGSSQA
ncbi:multidrug effflux MFS transporter [Albimonas sp. CAU 1670]|uniref:multidrug effflux MFS transporter n=1 Tax=Albimonas sp. CAU 1670 TaxID=3032599 RepID=UPI0023DB122C|nr:multidrug effflux MFS transporter [Albimonas sp. CAU 1670]MDF2234451.1 multidrug effflux MFS transporter [Albimonas sp. CAU 1670]